MEQFTHQQPVRSVVLPQFSGRPANLNGDFAAGQRTMPLSNEGPDYARGQESQTPLIEGPDFARGERTQPMAPTGPDYARGLRQIDQ